MSLASIAGDVRDLSQKLGLSSDLAVIERAWSIEMGNLTDVARIVALDHAALVVETTSNTVMQEISLRRRELVRKLNKHLPAPGLSQIIVKISQ